MTLTAVHSQQRLARNRLECDEEAFSAIQSKSSEIVYPDSDGEPMGETGIHVQAIMYVYLSLIHI